MAAQTSRLKQLKHWMIYTYIRPKLHLPPFAPDALLMSTFLVSPVVFAGLENRVTSFEIICIP